MVLGEEFLKAKFGVRAAVCVTFFWLVGGEVRGQCSRNLVLSLKLPSSTWVEALDPVEVISGDLSLQQLEAGFRFPVGNWS